jgi:GTP-binding protein
MLDEELMEAIKAELPEEVPHLFISSVANKNIQQLKDLLWQALEAENSTEQVENEESLE